MCVVVCVVGKWSLLESIAWWLKVHGPWSMVQAQTVAILLFLSRSFELELANFMHPNCYIDSSASPYTEILVCVCVCVHACVRACMHV